MPLALEGLTIVECGIDGAATYAAKVLADLGAEVIKVEPPAGDPDRELGPFPGHEPHRDKSGTFLYLNTNKLGVTLDLSTEPGRQALAGLAAKADALIHDYTPKEAEEAGLTYDAIRAANPDIIMTAITPFGMTGPQKDWAATDLTLQAAGGWLWMNGWPMEVDKPPLKAYGRQPSYQGGINGALATMGALYGKSRGLPGQHIDISIQECIASITEFNLPMWSYMETPLFRYGQRPIHPIDFFQCKDGEWIFVLCIEEHQWQRLVELMDTPEWATWEVAANRLVRASNWDALRPFMEEWVSQWNAEDLYRAAQDKRIPFAPVSTLGSLLDSDHLKARGFFIEVAHAEAGTLKHAGAPYQLSETPWEIRLPAPTLGQHNDEVFSRFGIEVMA
ncbi:MAG TPA: CoA transferase [Dehalococcoidia bacterium]|nr:CoA transferase [Dehalococcoidia bacterium]